MHSWKRCDRPKYVCSVLAVQLQLTLYFNYMQESVSCGCVIDISLFAEH